MDDLKNNIKANALNEDKLLSTLYQRIENDHLRSNWQKSPKESYMKKRGLLFFGLVFVLVAGVFIANPGKWFGDTKIVAAYVSVDINPSFELATNNDGYVLSVSSLNDDALSLETTDLVGMSIEDAIDVIVQRATDAGFIDPTDLVDDYVVVTTVVTTDATTDLQTTLSTRLATKIQSSDTLQCVNLVELTATSTEQTAAQSCDTPLGIYLLNQAINRSTDSMLSVGQFFADNNNAQAIQTRAKITALSETKLKERLELALDKLDNAGIDTTELRQRLENANLETALQIQNEVKLSENALGNGNDGTSGQAGDGNTDTSNQAGNNDTTDQTGNDNNQSDNGNSDDQTGNSDANTNTTNGQNQSGKQ